MNLKRRIFENIDLSLNHHSRIHTLCGYIPQTNRSPVFIKREDELNPTAIGTKHRKYISLLPSIRQANYTTVILIGSAYSNNLLGLTQHLLNEHIEVHLFVKRPGSHELTGNRLFLNMLLPQSNIHTISPNHWNEVVEQANEFAAQLQGANRQVLVVPEGGEHPATIPGLLTLAFDIQQNQQTYNIRFSDIWTDSGTGISAIGLLLGMRLLGMTETHLHITLIAGNEAEFFERYRRFTTWTEQWLKAEIPEAGPRVTFHTPATARSFGSINKTVQRATITIARETGILMDPIYSVKHLYTMKQILQQHPPTGPQLFIYNGGPLGLCGFQQTLAKQLRTQKD